MLRDYFLANVRFHCTVSKNTQDKIDDFCVGVILEQSTQNFEATQLFEGLQVGLIGGQVGFDFGKALQLQFQIGSLVDVVYQPQGSLDVTVGCHCS